MSSLVLLAAFIAGFVVMLVLGSIVGWVLDRVADHYRVQR